MFGVCLSKRDEKEVVLGFRIISFFVGLSLLLSGVGDFSAVLGMDIGSALSVAGIAFVKILIGVFLMALGVNPERVWMSIEWIIETRR